MELAPIVLFVYNRPQHTQQLLNSLAANEESRDSVLYVYCDGVKNDADSASQDQIEQTRSVVAGETRFKNIIINVQDQNKGLASSIIGGVTDVVNEHGRVIVLEDDLIVSPFFLFYMNDSLKRYDTNKKVGQIGACNFFACGSKYPSTFFIPISDCWGWATWKDRWRSFEPDATILLSQLREKELIYKFNVYGTYDMVGMLKMQIEKKVDSWAIRWQAVCVLNYWHTLYPNPSVSNHIESDNATHANVSVSPPLLSSAPVFSTQKVMEIPTVIKALKRGYSGVGDYSGKIKPGFRFNFFKKKMSILLNKASVVKRHLYKIKNFTN